MANLIFEPGDTPMFTFQSSVAPNSEPNFAVYDVDGSLVSSFASVQSDATNYYALFTMPGSDGWYVGEWNALKTFQGSARAFKTRFPFKVLKTVAEV